ncbi:MAG: erythromycin esterase family protein [Candidatus Acidiferrales bacterium]
MPVRDDYDVLSAIRKSAHRLTGESTDFDPLLEQIGEARFVLIGEASHGTHEFYRLRAQLTKRLIAEKGFHAVAVEADWPDAYRVNQFVRAEGEDQDAVDALAGFRRFPAWMWRNADVLDFVGWLRNYNEHHGKLVGFYGLDLYSLHSSMRAVLDFLDKVDPEAARRARYRYSCFEQFGEDTQAYGYAAGFGLAKSCEDEATTQWLEMRRRAADLSRRDGRAFPDEFFFAEQNARLVKNAEEYYRSMFRDRISSWNLRDTHMAETFKALVEHFGAKDAKIVVWAHNSHLGDARATEMGQRGELNLGQLLRQRYAGQVFLVGFSTFTGTVTAASEWDGPAERKFVRPALPESYESLFHNSGIPNFLLVLDEDQEARRHLRLPRLERAIGVIYAPQSERLSHYFHAQLADQFDAILHFDETRAVEPLERAAVWEHGEVPETYPSML